MKNIKYIIIIAVIAIIGISLLGTENEEDYQKTINDKISDRVDYLKNSDQSPFQIHNIPFSKPTYFPIDKSYRVNATIERANEKERTIIESSDGSSQIYLKYGTAHFKLKGQDLELIILKPTGFGSLNQFFVGFADATSSVSTYGGGRYLDVVIGKSDNITIDFNLAYNPYCAYSSEYSCPLPPKENFLNIAIEAGEKDYKH